MPVKRYPWALWMDGRVHRITLEATYSQPIPESALEVSLGVRARKTSRSVGWSLVPADAAAGVPPHTVLVQFDPPADSDFQRYYPSRQRGSFVSTASEALGL